MPKQVVVRGHKEHMDDCTAAKPAPGSGTVEIEGLDELEAEEEKRLTSSTEAHTRRQHLQESPAKVYQGVMFLRCIQYNAWYQMGSDASANTDNMERGSLMRRAGLCACFDLCTNCRSQLPGRCPPGDTNMFRIPHVPAWQ